MTYSTDKPLLNQFIQEIETSYSLLEFPWVTSQQTKQSNTNEILDRTFFELEFPVSTTKWKIVDKPLNDIGSLHYSGKSVMLAHTYSASKVQIGGVQNMSDFNGWNYLVSKYYLDNLYTDTLVRVITWRIYSDAAFDTFTTTNEAGELISSSVTYNGRVATVPTKGVGFTATTYNAPSTPFSVLNANSSSSSNTTTMVLNQANKQILSGNTLYITRPIVTRTFSNEQNPPVLLAQITIQLFGKYFSQGIGLDEMYDQGWVIHPANTSPTDKLKPPGKAYLNDNFVDSNTGIITGLNKGDV